jgi:hypothetical protein
MCFIYNFDDIMIGSVVGIKASQTDFKKSCHLYKTHHHTSIAMLINDVIMHNFNLTCMSFLHAAQIKMHNFQCIISTS